MSFCRSVMVAGLVWAALVFDCGSVAGQTEPAANPVQVTPQSPPAPPASAEPTPGTPEPSASQGTVLFQSHGEPPPPEREPAVPGRRVLPLSKDREAAASKDGSEPEFSDGERAALTFTSYDLDARVLSSSGGLAVRARLTVRNGGSVPLARIALQVSSTLTWESVSLLTTEGARPLPLAQHLLDTDTDHTGKANEALLELPEPLLPDGTLVLDALYSGAIPQSGERLLRIGANDAQSAAADWDVISGGGVWLRGFGNVLWYPVSSPQVFLGEGTRLFDAVDRTRLEQQVAMMRLRLSVEYTGEAPAAAYFCGRRGVFTTVSEVLDVPGTLGMGVATVEFPAEPLGFRMPSLFVVTKREVMAAPLREGVAEGEPMLAFATTNEAATPALAAATEHVVPLFQQWLGARPLGVLTVIEPPNGRGQAFEDGPLLVAPIPALTTSDAAAALTFSLTHAWIQSGRPWMDEGLAQFFALLELEQERGRGAMVAQLGEVLKPVIVPEQGPEEALVAAGSEVYYRRKAAAVWLMLREIVGDQALQVTLQAWRLRAPANTTAAEDAAELEGMLEKNSGKDLHRFFEDWVLQARGLPDLTLADISPRALPVTATGRSGGWLTTVTVTNAGGAIADVPVIVSSGSFSTTVRVVVRAAGSDGPGTATVRVQTEAAPTEVQVNDGITPEARVSVHRRTVRSL